MREVGSAGRPRLEIATWKSNGDPLQYLRCDHFAFVLVLTEPGLDGDCD